jgi:PGF-pre-PGF domain-containing protein/PGF-CTERM protein
MKKSFAGVLVLVLLCLQTASAETPISSCTNINSPGYYNLTSDLNGNYDNQAYCIGIFASDVVLEGNGHSLITGSGVGIYVYGVSNVTIKNVTVEDYVYGVYLYSSSNSNVTNVTVSGNSWYGIYLSSSNNNNITDVTASNNGIGILVQFSSYNSIANVTASSNGDGIYLYSSSNSNVTNVTASSNSYYGIRLYSSSYNRITDVTASNNEDGIYLYSSSNNTITDVTASDNSYGIFLDYSDNNNITDVTASNNQGSGVYLESSSNVTVAKSKIRSNNLGGTWAGIFVHNSSNITVSENTVTNNKYYGLGIYNVQNLKLQNNQIVDNCGGEAGAYLHSITGGSVTGNNISENTGTGLAIYYSSNNIIENNTIQGNLKEGVYLYSSSNNLIYNNTIQDNLWEGVYLYSSSSNNTIRDNVLQNNSYGIYLESASNNLIYNNYFNNTNNVTIYDSQPNTWNVTRTEGTNIVGGNYLGGNYWGSPNGDGFSDVCGDSDSDGICDGPFAIDGNNTDYLPLAKMFTVSGFLSYTGNQNGKIYVCAVTILGNPPGYCTEASAREYSLKVASGSYYIAAFMDVNGNAAPDSAEPIGFAIDKMYPEERIQVSQDISGVNITLYDVDLNISEVEIYPSQPIVGQQITLNATIRNLGGSFAENFNVSVYVNGQLVDTKTISLYFNETKYVKFVSPRLDAGTYSIKIAVDPDDAVNESDESNNEYLLSLYVHPTPTPTPTHTPTPRPPPIGGGGTGTGGGGYIPGTGVYYTPRELVKAGESHEIAMPQSFFIDTGVVSVKVKPGEDTTVQLRVERLKELPPGIPRPEGLAVLILSIEPRTGVETSLSGKIKFGVSIEEIKAKGFDPNLVTVILMRWDGSRWTELPTKFLSSDGKYNYYEAETQGFSYFAAVIKPVETPVPTTPVLTPAATATPTTPATTAPAKPFIPGFEAIFAVAGLLAAAYLLRRKN